MSDEKVNFDGKGNYSFGDEMHEMDVNTAGGRRAGTGRSRGKVKVFTGGEPEKEPKEPAKFDLQKMRDMAKKPAEPADDKVEPQPAEETVAPAIVEAPTEPTPEPVGEEPVKSEKNPLDEIPAPSPIRQMVPDVALQEMGLKVKPTEEDTSSEGKAATGMNLNTLMRRSRQGAGQNSAAPAEPKTKEPTKEAEDKSEEKPSVSHIAEDSAVTAPTATVAEPQATTEETRVTEDSKAEKNGEAVSTTEPHDFNLEKMSLETGNAAVESSTSSAPAVAHEPPKSEDGRFIVMDIVSFLHMFSDGSEQVNAGLVHWIISACKLKVRQPMATIESIEYPGLKLYGLSFLSGAGSTARYMALLGHGDAISACTWNAERSTAIDCTSKITVTDICACLADTPIIAFADRNRSGVKR